MGEATHRAADKAIVFEAAGEQVLKGKPAPVPAWRAVRVVAERGGRNRSDSLEAPFVGRDDELRLLKDLYHATVREQRPRLVSVIGPAGIGKTRMAWEFLKYIDGLVEGVWWHSGRSPAYGDGISFWALGEMVRGRAGLVETDDEATTRAGIAEMIATYVTDESERRWIESALLALLGLETGIASEQLFGAWRTFFERLAATGPVLMVFEDAHYADAGVLDFIDHMMDWSKGLPIYVVTLARPELLDKRETWGAGKRSFNSVYLEPLPEPAMRELLLGLVPGLPSEATSAIVARADGIPLYAVETVRMLVADGRLELQGDVYVPVGDLSRLAVPETLTALIASRLDALPAIDRGLVADAAVLGQSFVTAGLAAVSGMGESDLEQHMRNLVRRELFTLEIDARSAERGQYSFVQALIREVAYNTLARADRKTRHLAAARYFEALGSDELAGALAGHYLAAHANAADGPEADALAGQARLALRGAGERAAVLGSHDQAVTFFDQALDVTTEPAERAELLERGGESAAVAGHHDSAERHLRDAVTIRRELPERPATARAIAKLGQVLLSARRTAEANEVLEPATAEFADLGDDPALALLFGQRARVGFFSGDNRRAIEMADRALEVAEREGLTALLADTLISKGSALSNLGRVQEGVGVIEIGERIATSAGLTATLLRGLNNRSVSLGEIDPTAAIEASAAGLAEARRVGLRFWVLGFSVGVGYAALMLGDWDRAEAALSEALADDPDPEDRLSVLSNFVLLRAYRGDDVSTLLAELTRLTEATMDPVLVSSLHEARGAAALASGRLSEAYAEKMTAAEVGGVNITTHWAQAARAALWAGDTTGANTALETLEAAGFRVPTAEARTVTIRAGLAAAVGDEAAAIRLYRDALRHWRDLRIEFEEALCGMDMAILLEPSNPDVRAAADSARSFLIRVHATPLLDRLEAAIARSSVTAPASDRASATAADAAISRS